MIHPSRLVGTTLVALGMSALITACAPEGAGPGSDSDAGITPQPGQPDAAPSPQPGQPDARPNPNPNPNPNPAGGPGEACGCDSDCPAVAGHAGVCVYGVCMTMASGECSAAGSTAECPGGSRCWGLQGETGYFCWPDCASNTCDGTCDGDGSCAPDSNTNCSASCGTYCSCSINSDCGSGEQCVSGDCIPQSNGTGPGPGPGPTCSNLPPRDCTGSASYCGELVTFDPRVTAYYDDYPINGETSTNQYRSYLRRDLEMLLEHATAKVLCKAGSWDTGIGGPLGFGDMSEANGAIPGTSVGSPGHPANTHTNGYDIDLAYYQVAQPNNYLRPICNHMNGSTEANHCVSDPTILDVWRHALFLGILFESPRVRVIGVDGKAGPMISAAMTELCNSGWLSQTACTNAASGLAYETTDMGWGWYYFHHHHSHISLEQVSSAAPTKTGPMQCKDKTCNGVAVKRHPHRLRFDPL
jgi:hypothetical protein